MRHFNNVRKYGLGAVLFSAAGTALATPPTATDTMLANAETALNSAKDDGLTMGGYVVATVVGLLVVGIIISMARKAR